MKKKLVLFKYVILLGFAYFLTACASKDGKQNTLAQSKPAVVASVKNQIKFPLSQAWGGAVYCPVNDNCLLAAIEHEISQLVLLEFSDNKTIALDKKPLAYHPDSAIWLTPEIVVAAVETGGTLDFFSVNEKKLSKIDSQPVGFSPRDVILVKHHAENYTLLATPYSGKHVSWVQWNKKNPSQSKLSTTFWCEAPWHPTHVKQLPKNQGAGIAVACLDDKKVIAVPLTDLSAKPQTLAEFDVIPRQARPSPSGRWLYVALETGGKNARIDMQTGELQWIAGDPRGSSGVLALADDTVVWSDSQRLTLQKLDAQGQVLASKEMKTTGYSTELQLHDINRDGVDDILVLNSTGETSDVIFGPVWKD